MWFNIQQINSIHQNRQLHRVHLSDDHPFIRDGEPELQANRTEQLREQVLRFSTLRLARGLDDKKTRTQQLLLSKETKYLALMKFMSSHLDKVKILSKKT